MPAEYCGIAIQEDKPEELFELLESIGSGTFGSVFRARHRRTGETVAIKKISLAGEDEIKMVATEVSIMRESVHPNIVRYYGTYKSLSELWIVMEYCEGGSIDLVFKALRRPLPEKLIAYVCSCVLKGLQYLHAQNRIHRDIKGGNILITRDGRVKLADFGVSAELSHTLSRRNSFIGTVNWMAPEVIQEKEYDARADLWSLGITVIEIAEAAPPHSGKAPVIVMNIISREEPPVLRHKDRWSPQMNMFLRRLLVKDHSVRPTAEMMLRDPFVQEEFIGTPAELEEVMLEVIAKLNLRRAGQLPEDSWSSYSTATFRRIDSATSGSDGRRGSGGRSEGDRGAHDRTQRPPRAERRDGDPGRLPQAGGDSLSAAGRDRGDHGIEPFFVDGTLVPLPILDTEDLSFDALGLDAVGRTHQAMWAARHQHQQPLPPSHHVDASHAVPLGRQAATPATRGLAAGARAPAGGRTTAAGGATGLGVGGHPASFLGSTSGRPSRAPPREVSAPSGPSTGAHPSPGGATRVASASGKSHRWHAHATTTVHEPAGAPRDGHDAPALTDAEVSAIAAALLAYHTDPPPALAVASAPPPAVKSRLSPSGSRVRPSPQLSRHGSARQHRAARHSAPGSPFTSATPPGVPTACAPPTSPLSPFHFVTGHIGAPPPEMPACFDREPVGEPPKTLMHMTQSLLDAFIYHKELPTHRGLTAERASEVAALTEKYGSALKTIFRM